MGYPSKSSYVNCKEMNSLGQLTYVLGAKEFSISPYNWAYGEEDISKLTNKGSLFQAIKPSNLV